MVIHDSEGQHPTTPSYNDFMKKKEKVKIPIINLRMLDVFEDSCCVEGGALSPIAKGNPISVCKFCGKRFIKVAGGKLVHMGSKNRVVEVEKVKGSITEVQEEDE